jgi:hypothetical protein
MPYWLRFTIFLLVVNVLAFGVGTLLSDFSFYWVLLFAVVAPYVVIVTGRWCLKRDRL